MRVLFHSAGLVLFLGLFLAGKLMVKDCERWAVALPVNPASGWRARNFFLYGGTIFEWVAFVGGLLEFVAVMVLLSGLMIDQMVALSTLSRRILPRGGSAVGTAEGASAVVPWA